MGSVTELYSLCGYVEAYVCCIKVEAFSLDGIIPALYVCVTANMGLQSPFLPLPGLQLLAVKCELTAGKGNHNMDSDRRRTLTSNQKKRPGRANEKIFKHHENGSKGKGPTSKGSVIKSDMSTSVSDASSGKEIPEVYDHMVIHYVDDVNRSESECTHGNGKTCIPASKHQDGETLDDNSVQLDKSSQGKLDGDTAMDPVSSQVAEEIASSEGGSIKLQLGIVENNNKVSEKYGEELSANSSASLLRSIEFPTKHSSGSSGGTEQKPAEDYREVGVLDDASNGTQNVGSEDERFDIVENVIHKTQADLEYKIHEMEMRVEKLEEELREVAALEISLYSVVPEHGSSAHKVHTPTRRLFRLYMHAYKHWTQNRRDTIARNTISGLILIARSCSNDVSRLTYWLSNTAVLREIISQAFGSSHDASPFTRFAEPIRSTESNEGNSTQKWKGCFNHKPRNGFLQVMDDWREAGTFIAALENVESWIFSRVVELIWWQALMMHAQTPGGKSSSSKATGRLLGPDLGDQQQGSFSVDLWRIAFQDAFHRLCPVRAGGHDCGCLPVVARMVMKQCVSRLDVAIFNAILRESVHETPTDPVSDPIVDPLVLPIPAGYLSFGSGVQLKNSVGYWSRWIADAFGVDTYDAVNHETHGQDEPRQFMLLNELSDLLMLPKDMLMERSIRKEVCPSISLTLVKRILCNFTPDEFCPDAVPGSVLEALNSESIEERQLSGETTTRSFPYAAAPVLYSPPSSGDVAEKVGEAGERSHMWRSVSMVQKKGHTSDEELEDLDSPLNSLTDRLQSPPISPSNGSQNGSHTADSAMNVRYKLLLEVWSSDEELESSS
ncbi:hypothetical protein SAY86_005095 [Trapa natans]|uniref:Dilute domain-containing protein n=1 Tax=Trapa natans TaxID=22666 RepID=A0AAN7L8H2_TRANT|nr:hypothetical protein SAY86_005095 [Trapa natans]